MGVNQYCMGAYQYCMGVHQYCMGAYQYCMGAYQYCMGVYQYCMGVHQYCMGVYQYCMGAYQYCMVCTSTAWVSTSTVWCVPVLHGCLPVLYGCAPVLCGCAVLTISLVCTGIVCPRKYQYVHSAHHSRVGVLTQLGGQLILHIPPLLCLLRGHPDVLGLDVLQLLVLLTESYVGSGHHVAATLIYVGCLHHDGHSAVSSVHL